MTQRRDPAELAEIIANAASDRKAADVAILDLRGISSVTDFFVICTGRSDVHVRAICERIEETLSELGPLGLLLVVSIAAVPLVVSVRRRGDPIAAASGAAFAVFAVHAGLDWDWEMPVVTLTALGCAGVVLTRSSTAPKEERT